MMKSIEASIQAGIIIGLFSMNGHLLDWICRKAEGVRVAHAHWEVSGGTMGFVDLIKLSDEFREKKCDVIFLDCSELYMVDLFAWGLMMSQLDTSWVKGFVLVNASRPIISATRMIKDRAGVTFLSKIMAFKTWPPCFERRRTARA